MHEAISCALACRKSNIHGVAIGTSANERDDRAAAMPLSDKSLFRSLSRPRSRFFMPPFDPRRRAADSADRALIASLTLAAGLTSARLPDVLIAGFSTRQLSCFSTRGTFCSRPDQFSLSLNGSKRVEKNVEDVSEPIQRDRVSKHDIAYACVLEDQKCKI